jgi:hypothetical protein
LVIRRRESPRRRFASRRSLEKVRDLDAVEIGELGQDREGRDNVAALVQRQALRAAVNSDGREFDAPAVLLAGGAQARALNCFVTGSFLSRTRKTAPVGAACG